jgi:hypothetical protein
VPVANCPRDTGSVTELPINDALQWAGMSSWPVVVCVCAG